MQSVELENLFFPAIQKCTQETLKEWNLWHRRSFTPLQKIAQEFTAHLKKEGENDPIELYKSLEIAFTSLLDWIKSFDEKSAEIFSSAFIEEWEKIFAENAGKCVSVIELPYLPDYWNPQKKDPVKIKMWKYLKRRQNGVKSLHLRVRNTIKSMLKRPLLTPLKDSRKVILKPFMAYYIQVPVSEFLFQEWLFYLQRLANFLYEIHITSEEIKNVSLFLNKDAKSCAVPDPDIIAESMEQMQDKLDQLLTLMKQEMTNQDYDERLNQFLQEKSQSLESLWKDAGTFALSNYSYRMSRVKTKNSALVKRKEKHKTAWKKHIEVEQHEWQKDIELSLLQLRSILLQTETNQTVSQTLNETVLPTFDAGVKSIQTTLTNLNRVESDRKTDFKSLITSEKNDLLKTLRQQKLPTMLDAVLKSQLDHLLQKHLTTLISQGQVLAANHLIFEFRDLQRLLPRSKIDSVPFKKLVEEEIHPALTKKKGILFTEIHEDLERILRDISEIDHIVEFNMETALNLLKQKGNGELLEEAKKVTIEGLERATNQVNDLIERNRQVESDIQRHLQEVTFDYVSGLQLLEDSEQVLTLKLNLMRANAKQKIKNYGNQSIGYVKNAGLTAIRHGDKIFRHLQSGYFRIRKMAGLAPIEGVLEEKLAHYLSDTQQQISALPSVYQRLFQIEPLSDEKFYVGRESEMSLLEKTLNDWQSGLRATTAIIGEKGSGRTTLLNFVEERYFKKHHLVKINLVDTTITSEKALLALLANSFQEEDVQTMDELETQLLEKDERMICVFENTQNLFMRTVDGFEAVKRLLLFITRTYNNIFWIVTCTLYSWTFLDKVVNLGKYFHNIVELGAIPNDEIENLILKRHRISGYKLMFEVPERLARSRKFKKLATDEKRQDFLLHSCFEQLNQFAAGNVSIAILYWLGAIKDISKEGMLLAPSIEFDYSFLDQLSADELFTLAALLQHETLSAEEHALIFHQGIEQSFLLLNRMSNRRMLLNVRNRYQIHHLLFRPVVRILKTRNIIY